MAEACEHLFLVDNGSLAPAAIRSLRALAEKLGARLGRLVEPVSVLHADKVPAAELGGRAAEVLEAAVRRRANAGARRFGVVPLFIGPSRALTEFLPESTERWRGEFGGLTMTVADPLHRAGEMVLAEMLADFVRATGPARGATKVAVVDHGSPVRAVTAARDEIAAQLAVLLGGAAEVAPCSMERRAGEAYAFNEPLLETLLDAPGWRGGDVVVAQLFLQQGRHAGPQGDVAQICARAEAASAGGRVRRTPLLGEHPRLIDLLAARAREVMAR
ncbi:CbiX/SirB N-terminal domain-containing protein [Horticoccus luteus]|uniref:CbiX/SirB N-terminal domain-containing protein n=1 Tax=Horticoccus luteus TaxID=2862869 RepID=A0A8F9TUI6_9BACT|nr:CbiX/SirB N-terminal domain-containing protein [Horticoccus luteus]QYM78033.1 CbiX/SirB N-terminal domain-containing protein [Horticoccus luteus]